MMEMPVDKSTYVTEQLSLMVGHPVQPDDAMIDRFWYALSREEERAAYCDAHGNFPAHLSVFHRMGLLEEPPLHADILTLCEQCPAVPPRWPDGRRFAVCLTHDVDRIVKLPWRERWRQWQAIGHTAGLLPSARWLLSGTAFAGGTMLGLSDLRPFDQWMDEEARFGFHSTFFVLPERLEQPTVHDHFYRHADRVRFRGHAMPFAAAVRETVDAGWEIGLHGSYASAYNAIFLRDERAQIEAISGKPVRAVRQHFLRFSVDATPRAQAQAGLEVDSTLGFSSTIGCRAGLAFPYFWPGLDLLEVPLSIQDVGLLRHHGRHGNWHTAVERARALIMQVAAAGGVVTLSWHTHPESSGAAPCYRRLLQLVADLGGWGCTLGELNSWWRQRRARLQDRRSDEVEDTPGK